MAKLIQLDRCSNIGVSNKIYESISYTNYNDKEDTSAVIYNSANTLVRRVVKLSNRIIDFEYYTKKFKNNLFSLINSVNSKQINIGGLTIPENGAKLLLLSTAEVELQNDNKIENFCKVQVKLEIGDSKSVFCTITPIEDVYFINPKTNKRTRIQFSSDPDKYLNNLQDYPNAIHIVNGLGFYSEDRSDLNIIEPVPLDKLGNISSDGVVYYMKSIDAVRKDWGAFKFPTKGLI